MNPDNHPTPHSLESDSLPCLLYRIKGTSRMGPALHYSNFLENLTGYKPSEVYNNPEFWPSIIHPEDRDRVLAIDRFSSKNLTSFRADYRILKKTSDICWVMDESAIDQSGDRVGYTADISLGKRMDESIRAGSTMFRAMVEDLTEAVCRFESNTRITYINDAFEKLFRAPRERLVDSHFIQLVHHDHRDLFWKTVRELSPLNTKTEIELLMLADSTENRWIEWTVRSFEGNSAKIEEYQIVGRDIHQRKLAVQNAEFSLAQLQAVYGAVPYYIGILEQDVSGIPRFVSINDAAGHFFSISPADIQGKSFREVGMPFDNDSDLLPSNTGERTELGSLKPKVFWIPILMKKRYFSSTASKFINKANGKEYICFVWHDITLQVETETMLKRAGFSPRDGEQWTIEAQAI